MIRQSSMTTFWFVAAFWFCIRRLVRHSTMDLRMNCSAANESAEESAECWRTPARFGALVLEETLRRNLRKTPAERVETLLAALRDTEQRGWWPQVDRKAKEQKLLCSIQKKSSPR